MPGVARIRIYRIKPVLESDRVRVAPQVTKVLHRHKRSIEELIPNRLALDDIAQDLTAIHLTAIECIDQRLLVGNCDFRVRFERVHVSGV